MANQFYTALKENKNNIRKKVLILGGVVITAVAAGVVLHKINSEALDVLIVSAEDLVAATTEALPE